MALRCQSHQFANSLLLLISRGRRCEDIPTEHRSAKPPTPQKALDALKEVDRKTLEYSPSQGYCSLRNALVNYYERYQIKLSADDIIITCGGSEAVLFAFMSCLKPGDEIIVPEPAYANYMAFAVSAGAVIRTITTTIDEGFCLP